MTRPSIYYRIKSKQGQVLYMLIVSDTFGNDTYDVHIKGVLTTFRFKLNNHRNRMKVSDAVKLCLNKLDSESFKTNNCNGPDNDDCQNMCNFIPRTYGNKIKCMQNIMNLYLYNLYQYNLKVMIMK
jgi:hypothetical protein